MRPALPGRPGWLADAGLTLPEDPARLREWSILMALTGVCNAVDRGLVPAGYEIVVHGTGSYCDDFRIAEADAEVSTLADVVAAVLDQR
ncbi:DUF6002 family protein [Micromonospora sp. BRA006-A]|nr:DUF6002 family protein [Micromonospora sp. BRA006-A]